MGEQFTAADAYLFVIVGWSGFASIDLTPFPALRSAWLAHRKCKRLKLSAVMRQLRTGRQTLFLASADLPR